MMNATITYQPHVHRRGTAYISAVQIHRNGHYVTSIDAVTAAQMHADPEMHAAASVAMETAHRLNTYEALPNPPDPFATAVPESYAQTYVGDQSLKHVGHRRCDPNDIVAKLRLHHATAPATTASDDALQDARDVRAQQDDATGP